MEQPAAPNRPVAWPRTHPWVASASRHWKRNYLIGGVAVLVAALVTLFACNVVNIRNEPTPYTDGYAADCPPSYFFYPDYQRALGFPLPLLEPLYPSKRAVTRARLHTKRCFHPDKQNRNLAMKGHKEQLRDVGEALDYAAFLLKEWDWYGFRMTQKDIDQALSFEWFGIGKWETLIRGEISFPHFKQGCAPCSLGKAIKTDLYKLVTPYWYHSYPKSINEIGEYCPPCNIGIFKEGWDRIGTLRFNLLGLPYIEWNAKNLPPRCLHSFYFDEIFDRTWNPVLLSLASWGRCGEWWSNRTKLRALPKKEKMGLIEAGWMGFGDFDLDDPDITKEREAEKERLRQKHLMEREEREKAQAPFWENPEWEPIMQRPKGWRKWAGW